MTGGLLDELEPLFLLASVGAGRPWPSDAYLRARARGLFAAARAAELLELARVAGDELEALRVQHDAKQAEARDLLELVDMWARAAEDLAREAASLDPCRPWPRLPSEDLT